MKRSELKSKPKRQDWRLIGHGPCLVADMGDCDGPIERAHTVGRASQDVEQENGTYLVIPAAIVHMCKAHHMMFDAHELDILAYLDIDHQLNAVDAAGGIYRAYHKLTGRRPE